MKNVLRNITAILLLIWYSMSVVGFDVHTCSKSGRVFIATVITGTDCEDIHSLYGSPACSCCSDCHHHGCQDEKMSAKPCCTDQWQMISLTGVRTDNDSRDFLAGGLCPLVCIMAGDDFASNDPSIDLRGLTWPQPGQMHCRDVHKVCNIWRI